MADAKCRICNKRPAARTGAQNRTPTSRMAAIKAGVCNPCFENVEDAKMFLGRDANLTPDERAHFENLVATFNQKDN